MKRKSILRTAAVAGAALILTACGSSGGSSGTTAASAGGGGLQTVTFAINAFVGVAPIHLGQMQGIFKKYGINLKFNVISATPAVLEAVAAGQDDIGFAVTPSVITAVGQKVPVKCIAPFSGNVSTVPAERSTALVVPANSPITSPSQLAGKKVAVGALAGEQAVLVQELVDNAGGNWQSVKLVPLGFGEMNAALQNHSVDAIATTEPYLGQAVAAGDKVFSWIEADLLPNYTMTCSVANDQFITAHPQLVAQFQKAMAASLTYAAGHISQVRTLLPSLLGITASAAQTLPLGVTYTPELNQQSILAVQSLMVKYGYVKQAAPLSSILDYPGVS
jgi:NitT/TauT family transport system substrate-binding protein